MLGVAGSQTVRLVTAGIAREAKIARMRNRIAFLQRVMDQVKRQAPGAACDDGVGPDADEGPFPASGVTPIQPLQLFIEVQTLRTLVADALEALRWSEVRICTTPERTAAWERAVDQRRRFLAWLSACGQDRVFLAIYPEYLFTQSADEDGPDEQVA
jgi:hypothetical protein